VQIGALSFRNGETMPLYKQATKEMLLEHDNIFSMFASFLGAEIQQKNRRHSAKRRQRSANGLHQIITSLAVNCKTKRGT